MDITWVGVNTETAQVGTAEAQSRVQALRTEYIFVVCFAILLMMFKVFFLLWVPCIRSKLTTPSTEDSDASLPLSAQDGESALSNAAPRKKMPFSNSDEAKWAHASYGMLITSTIVCILSLASTSDYRADLYPIALVGGFYVVHERVSCCCTGMKCPVLWLCFACCINLTVLCPPLFCMTTSGYLVCCQIHSRNNYVLAAGPFLAHFPLSVHIICFCHWWRSDR